jgi:hypothetical protein
MKSADGNVQTEADAGYALVTCSAMINYLLIKADKQGIVPKCCE